MVKSPKATGNVHGKSGHQGLQNEWSRMDEKEEGFRGCSEPLGKTLPIQLTDLLTCGNIEANEDNVKVGRRAWYLLGGKGS